MQQLFSANLVKKTGKSNNRSNNITATPLIASLIKQEILIIGILRKKLQQMTIFYETTRIFAEENEANNKLKKV